MSLRPRNTARKVAATTAGLVVVGGMLAMPVQASLGRQLLRGTEPVTYKACANKNSGAIRLVVKGKTCKSGEITLQWNVTGPAGIQGPTGPQGATGAQGEQGATGARGEPGATGAQGAQGVQGSNGSNGTNGTNGAPGQDGVDGAFIWQWRWSYDASDPTIGLTNTTFPVGTRIVPMLPTLTSDCASTTASVSDPDGEVLAWWTSVGPGSNIPPTGTASQVAATTGSMIVALQDCTGPALDSSVSLDFVFSTPTAIT